MSPAVQPQRSGRRPFWGYNFSSSGPFGAQKTGLPRAELPVGCLLLNGKVESQYLDVCPVTKFGGNALAKDSDFPVGKLH